jgi:hypothetical protein
MTPITRRVLASAALACVCVGLGSVSASAAPPSLPAGLAAAQLAKLIRHDARRLYARSRASVTVTERCCRVRVLRVHYRLKPTALHGTVGLHQTGSYVLTVESSGRKLQRVAISESVAEVEGTPEQANVRGNLEEELAVERISVGGGSRWIVTASEEDMSHTEEVVVDGHVILSGTGGSRECRLPRPLPRSVYRKVRVAFWDAEHHLPTQLTGTSGFC